MVKLKDYFNAIIENEYNEWPEWKGNNFTTYINDRGVVLYYYSDAVDMFFKEELFEARNKRLKVHLSDDSVGFWNANYGPNISFGKDKIYVNNFFNKLHVTFDLNLDNKCISVKWNDPSHNDEIIDIDEHMVDNIVEKIREIIVDSKCIQPYVSKKYAKLFDKIKICFVFRVLDICTQWVNMLYTELQGLQQERCQLTDGVFDPESEYYQLEYQSFCNMFADLEDKITCLETIIELAQFGMYNKDDECKKIMIKA